MATPRLSIPSEFQLGGRSWSVEFVEKVDDDDSLGDCHGAEAEIHLKEGMKAETAHHTFYHELCHALCFTLGWEKMNKDEGKIDALGGLLYQYLSTKKGSLL